MQFRRPGIVRIAAREDARSAGTARAGRKVKIGKFQPLLRHAVNVRGADFGISVAADVLGGNVVANDEDDVGWCLSRQRGGVRFFLR